VISVTKVVLRCDSLYVEVKGQYPVKVMDLCMEHFMAFHHHFLVSNNSIIQVDTN
jgi:hypothetical protein